jgi:hypothetical protein
MQRPNDFPFSQEVYDTISELIDMMNNVEASEELYEEIGKKALLIFEPIFSDEFEEYFTNRTIEDVFGKKIRTNFKLPTQCNR